MMGPSFARDARVCVAGTQTLIGSALRRELPILGYTNLSDGREPDFTDPRAVDAFFAADRPAYVFLVAGRSGGIRANQRFPADLARENLVVACNVMEAAFRHGVRKLLYVASSCVYPRDACQPMAVESLHSGPPEPTSAPYSIAKLAGIHLCQAYRRQHGASFVSAIAADAFGRGDDFDQEDAHVVAALIRRFHEAKVSRAPRVELWGTGAPRRDFIYAGDVADACILLMGEYDGPVPINVGSGTGTSITELAGLIKDVVGFLGEVRFDATAPDGAPEKVLDIRPLLGLGWRQRTTLAAALTETYAWFVAAGQERVAADAG